MNDNKFKVFDKNGEIKELELICTLNHNDKNYIVYNDCGNLLVSSYKIENGFYMLDQITEEEKKFIDEKLQEKVDDVFKGDLNERV